MMDVCKFMLSQESNVVQVWFLAVAAQKLGRPGVSVIKVCSLCMCKKLIDLIKNKNKIVIPTAM